MIGKTGLAGLVLAAAISTGGCVRPSGVLDNPLGPDTAPTSWPTPAPEHERAKVYVLNHTWYMSGQDMCPTQDPKRYWTAWIWPPKIDDPCETIPGAPWLRQISSNAYPLTGPYDGRNEEILRWQIRQAKSGGIDGFFVSAYTWAPNLRYVHGIFFGDSSNRGFLKIAQEENFKLGLELWKVEDNEVDTRGQAWKDAVGQEIASIESSQYKDAYIHIDGKPAVWIVHPHYMGTKELTEFLDGTPNNPRKISWIIRNADLGQIININGRLKNSKAHFESDYAFPSTKDWELWTDFSKDLRDVAANPNLGIEPIAKSYAGFDERSGKVDFNYGGRYGSRHGTSFMTKFLEDSVALGAKTIILESWNEWGEGSTIEAGINISRWRNQGQEKDLYLDETGRDNPYLYLDALRRFNGMSEWVPPRPPPCSAIDRLMLSHQSELPSSMRCTSETTSKSQD